MKYEVEIDEDMLKGYRPVKYGNPSFGDVYIDAMGSIVEAINDRGGFNLILERPREMKFRFCGYVRNNSVEAGKYYIENGYLKHSSHHTNYIKNDLEIWEKVDE